MLHVIYRLSDNGYPKEKFSFATKKYCIQKFFGAFCISPDYPPYCLHFLVDNTNLKEETYEYAMYEVNRHGMGFECIRYNGGSSAASWRYGADFALAIPGLADTDYIYHLEDDYIHRRDSLNVLMEGLERADYVSLYDHADKYIPASKGGNLQIDNNGGENTRVILTKSAHWKMTNSTTLTFAVQVSTFKEDKPLWDKWTAETYPHDFDAFLELRAKGRSLITPIPGWSTHCEPRWAAPLIDWEKA